MMKVRRACQTLSLFSSFSFLLSGWWRVDCEGDIGWVPASYIKPLCDDDDDDDDGDGDSIVTESFIAGQGKNSSSQLKQRQSKN